MRKRIEVLGMFLPEVADATRREFLIGSAGLLLLPTACGGNGEGEESASGETRSIEHALGTTEVPARPERVVALDTTPAEAALSLGVEPVGMIASVGEEGFPAHLEDRLENAEVVASFSTGVNFEAVAAQSPDLILGGSILDEEQYERLSEIAPTIADGGGQTDWKSDMLINARALGLEAEMEERISEFESSIAEFKEGMGSRLEGTTVSLVASFSESELRIYLPGSYMGQVVEEAGLRRPDYQMELTKGEDGDFAADISLEEVSLIDADAMFVMELEGGETNYLDRLEEEESPLYTNLRAVRNNAVHNVLYDAWLGGRGIISANIILDDIEECLLDGQ